MATTTATAHQTLLEKVDEIHEGLVRDLRFIGNEEFKGHCITCKEPIVGKVTSFTQQDIKFNFHPPCFQCANCKSSMEGKAFYIHEGKYLDQECYHKVVLGACSGCGKDFTDSTVVKASGKQYHPSCFTCITCKKALSGSYIDKENSFFCKTCYEKQFLPPCAACSKTILPEAGTNKLMAIEWKELKFHVACFACKLCSKPFSDLKAVLHNNDLLCKTCFASISN